MLTKGNATSVDINRTRLQLKVAEQPLRAAHGQAEAIRRHAVRRAGVAHLDGNALEVARRLAPLRYALATATRLALKEM